MTIPERLQIIGWISALLSVKINAIIDIRGSSTVPACRQTGSKKLFGMYTIYAIKSERDGRIYVGLTNNLERRIVEHNAGFVFSTKGYRPWKFLYKEEVATRQEARKREKYLKSGVGKEFLKSYPR